MKTQLIIDSGISATTNGFNNLVHRMGLSLSNQNKHNFKQWYDFSKSGSVIHAHMQSLEWLYGSVYRKHSCHYFLIYNFDVNKSELKLEHRESLSEFFRDIFADQLLKERNIYPREFEKYPAPFAARVRNKQLKEDLLNDQPWMPEGFASRESEIRISILNNYYEMDAESKWWAGSHIAFPDPLLKVTVAPDVKNAPFHINNLLYWRSPSKGQFLPFTGRASETGSDNVNDPLSKARSNKVADFIREKAREFGEELFLVSEGVGSKKPIMLTSENLSEIEENRSVQFSFCQEHDYVHLLTPYELKALYRKNIEKQNEYIKAWVDYGEQFLKELEESARNNSPKPVFNALNPNVESITKNLKNLDLEFSLGMHSVIFAKAFNGDFNSLNDLPHRSIPNTPPLTLFLRSNTVENENRNVGHYLPIPQIISRGKYNGESNIAAFGLPLSPDVRINYGAITLGKITDLYGDVYGIVSGNYETISGYFLEYYKAYTKNLILANSYLFSAYSYNEFKRLIADNDWTFSLDFTNDDPIYTNRHIELKIELHVNRFKEAFLRRFENEQKPEDKEFYWYNEDIRNSHYEMKKLIVKNVVKTSFLESEIKKLDRFIEYISFGKKPGRSGTYIVLIYPWITMADGKEI